MILSRICNLRHVSLAAAIIGVWFAAIAQSGCAPRIDIRGNIPDPTVISSIKLGSDTRNDIEQLLGTPSTIATFDQEVWYYIGARTKTVAFFEPEVVEQKVVLIQFDKAGVVTGVNKLDATDGRIIELVERETPTKGKELTLIQQILGNLGKFSSPDGDP